jgi:hypothetical protein
LGFLTRIEAAFSAMQGFDGGYGGMLGSGQQQQMVGISSYIVLAFIHSLTLTFPSLS